MTGARATETEARRAPAAAAPGPRFAAPVPDALPGARAPLVPACACGGGCPRCVSSPGDALEQEAERWAERALRDPALEPSLAGARARARLHTGPEAARLAGALDARAYTLGWDVVFGAGEFQPHTPAGRRLIAHELAHVAQQERAARPLVQRQQAGQTGGVVQMPPLVVQSTQLPTEQAVPHLDELRGQGVNPNQPTVQHLPADVTRNSPDPLRQLPFNAGGWDAQAILTSLGQYDTLPGTDSDAIRCVQAVALASRIVDGPRGVTGFLSAMILQGMLSRPMNARERAAMAVLRYVRERILDQRATFGDLIWAQEALHDLFYNDVSGTPEPDIRGQLGPAFDLGRSLTPMDVWCNGPQDVMTQANALRQGEQLLVNTWTVTLNTAFDDLEEQGIQVPEGRSIVVDVNGRQVRIRRVPSNVRPPHTAIDPVRDHRFGHQLLVMKDSASGTLRLYEPEITQSGQHLEGLRPDGSNFTRYFQDQPTFGIYEYIQILGKLSPSSLTAPIQWPSGGP